MGSRIFYKPTSHLKILGAWRVTCGKLHIKEPQILGVNVHNFDVGRQGTRGFAHGDTKSRMFVISFGKASVWTVGLSAYTCTQ